MVKAEGVSSLLGAGATPGSQWTTDPGLTGKQLWTQASYILEPCVAGPKGAQPLGLPTPYPQNPR